MAYTDNFPQRPVFMADFANGGRIDPRASFTRASTGTFFGTDKHISSENLILHSEGSAAWGGTATVNYNYTNGPDGVTGTALRLQSASGTERYRYSTGGQFVSGTAYTVSCWVKSNTGVAQTFRFMCSTTANQSADLTTHATDWTRVTATITPNTTNIFAGFVFLSANTNDISVWGLQVNTGSSALDYQATTTQIHRAYAPTLQTAAINAPRFEHSATDSASAAMGESLGLLVEGQAQNLAAYSSDFSNAAWTKTRTSVEANAAIGPDGTLSASLIRDVASTSNTHHVYQLLPSIASGTVVTASVFAKAAGRTFLIIQNGSTTPYGGSVYKVWFNLTAGTVGTISGSGVTASATDCGNGWTRCTVTFPASTSTSAHALQINSSEGDNDEYHVGDDYSGVLLYGAQYEQSSFGSSYIGTTSSAVTRAADSLSIATADIPGFSEGVGTVVYETGGVASGTATNQLAFGLRADSANFFTAGVNNGGVTDASVRVYSKTSDGDQAFLNPGTATVGTGYKLACRYELDNIAASMNGGTVVSDTSGKVPVGVDTLWVGELDGNYHLNSNVKRIAVYNEALSDTNLISLTS